MTTREAIYKTALEQIENEMDRMCEHCGWIGQESDLIENVENMGELCCPDCHESDFFIEMKPEDIARYALEMAEGVAP